MWWVYVYGLGRRLIDGWYVVGIVVGIGGGVLVFCRWWCIGWCFVGIVVLVFLGVFVVGRCIVVVGIVLCVVGLLCWVFGCFG